MVNHAVCKDIEIGKIKFRMSYGVFKLLISAKHIPNLKNNLISLKVLDKSKYVYTTRNRKLKVTQRNIGYLEE